MRFVEIILALVIWKSLIVNNDETGLSWAVVLAQNQDGNRSSLVFLAFFLDFSGLIGKNDPRKGGVFCGE